MYHCYRSCFFKKENWFPIKFSSDHDNVSALISTKIEDDLTLKAWIKDENNSSIDNKENFDLLKKHTTFNSVRAVTRISKDISTLSKDKVTPSHIYEYKTKSINFLKIKKVIFKN